MKEKTHKALIVIQTSIGAQLDQVGLAYSVLREKFETLAVSSVYISSNQGGNRAGGLLSVALVLQTTLSPKEFQLKLADLASRIPKTLELHLVAFDDTTLMTPELTLPHPELHVRPEWLIPSAEIWPEFSHPVLSRTLHELAGAEDWGAWGSFHAQGDALIEFHYNRRN